jgi:hypothetical protein
MAERPPLFPALNFDNGNNAAISLHILAEFARRGDVKVIHDGLDGTGKLVLRFRLPGSQTVRPSTVIR